MPFINFPSSKKITNLLSKSKSKPNSDIDYFRSLPPEIFVYILSWLPKHDLPNMLLVNKNFHQLTKELLLGKTYFQARSFLKFHHQELKQKTHAINRYLHHNKMHLFSGNRGMDVNEKSDFVFMCGISVTLYLAGSSLLLANYLDQSDRHEEQSIYNAFGASIAILVVIGLFNAMLHVNKYSHHRLMSTTVTAEDLDMVSHNSGINLGLAANANFQAGVTTLAQYEAVMKTALSTVTLHTNDIEKNFKSNPCIGNHDFTPDDLQSNAPINHSMAKYKYMDNAFQIWKKRRHAPKDEVVEVNQSSYDPSQQLS